MKVLITGGLGFFGIDATRLLEAEGHTVVCTSSRPKRYASFCSYQHLTGQGFLWNEQVRVEQMDILNPSSVMTLLERTQPELIIHAAALSQPMRCQENEHEAFAINAEGTKIVLRAAQETNVPFVHLSTDLVFDGAQSTKHSHGEWYSEADTPNAQIVYGRSKIASERIVHDSSFTQWIIVRPSLMIGAGAVWTKGFPQFATEALRSGQPVTLFTDQYRTPIWTHDLVRAIMLLASKRCFGELVHVGGAERFSRAAFIEWFCRVAGIDTSGIRAVPMDAVPTYTTRVHDVSLDSSKMQHLTGWQASSRATLTQAIINGAFDMLGVSQ
jgi:dTDP-4-dehydrorhamnose reductase